jgi:hypothetical protein
MLRFYAPVAAAVILIVTGTVLEAKFSDRFTGSSVTKEEFDQQFSALPKEVGSWVGTDNPVEQKILEVAGAVNYVSRTYRNTQTGAAVDLWLIVGHSRDIVRHTPDICYPSQGFAQDDIKPLKQRMEVTGEEDATFNTARFRNERAMGGGPALQRVFWAWNCDTDEEPQWQAPDSPRLHFGNNPRLFKMYFTANMKDRDEPVADSTAMEFAKVMLPRVNQTLFPKHYGAAAADAAANETPAPATPEGEAATATPAADPAANPKEALPAAAAPAE